MMTLGAKPAFDSSKFLALVHQMEVREAAFLKAIPDIVVAFDSSGKCLFFYPGSGMQWPFAINDLTGRFLTHCFPQDLVDRLQIAARKTRLSGRTEQFEFDLRKKSGESNQPLSLSGSDEVPAGFRQAIEEYYRSLARRGQQQQP